MYTRNIYIALISLLVTLIILLSCLYSLINEPYEVVISNNEINQNICTKDDTSIGINNLIAGVIEQSNNYLYQSLSDDSQINGVDVTDSQQDVLENYLTDREEYLLAKLVECEAGNQSIETKELVVISVLNRVEDSRFPDTIEEVIRQKDNNGTYQFSPLVEGGNFYYTEPSEESYKAIHNVIYGINDWYTYCECLWFECCESPDNWHSQNLDFVIKSGDVRFYK